MNTSKHTTLMDVTHTIRSGHPFRSKVKHSPAGEYAVLQLKDVQRDCHIDYSQIIQVEIKNGPAPHTLNKGDILLRARGGYYYSGLFQSDRTNVIASGQFFVLSPNRDIVDPAYLCWILNQPAAQQYLERNDTGSNIPMINKETVSRLPLPLPPLATQRKIAKIQRCWIEEKRITEQLLSNREQMVRGICQQFITGKTQ